MALLEVDNVRRAFGGVVALDRVSFDVAEGQIKAVIGPNGAGKTTLFNVISGLLKPETGRVRFKGRPINGLKPYQIARAGVARTFQNPSLFLQISVLENVIVGRHCRTRREFIGCGLRTPGQRREERAIRDAAMAWLDYVGVGHRAAGPAGALVRIFHSCQLASIRASRKRFFMDGLRFQGAGGCCEISQNSLFTEKTGASFVTQVCAFLTNSDTPELVRNAG